MVLLLQEFDLEIKDKTGSENVIVDHLSRLEKPMENERGNYVQLFQVSVQIPWYADIVNILSCGIMPPKFIYQQKRKLRTDARLYIWDDPLHFRRGADHIIRRCVPKAEQAGIMDKCHSSPYGGHFAGEKTT